MKTTIVILLFHRDGGDPRVAVHLDVCVCPVPGKHPWRRRLGAHGRRFAVVSLKQLGELVRHVLREA